MALTPVVFDLQGSQSVDHRDRGVARYVVELATAIEERHPDRVTAYVLNPERSLPSGIEALVASGKLRFADEPGVYDEGSILHLTSPFELSIPIDRLFPPAARAEPLQVAVTVFDLIPASMPDVYLEDAGLRRRYRARQELVRQADLVLAISGYTAAEVTRLLSVDAGRVRVVPLAATSRFRPPASRPEALGMARDLVPGLRDRFVLYTGGSDGRKNVEGLLRGWALIPNELRRAWQLVIAGSLPPLHRNHLEVMAASLDFAEEFLVTDFVDDETLVALNQAAGLFVFPSLAEGFGLPAAEALACGTPTIVADATSLIELAPPAARFDPQNPESIADAITRALTDGPHRDALLQIASAPARTWAAVADETVAAYDELEAPTRSRTRRPTARRTNNNPFRLAFTTPLPPQPGGVADYSSRLVEALSAICSVDVFVDGPPHHRDAVLASAERTEVRARPLATLERVESIEGAYDGIVYSLGNSEFHTGSLAALLRRPGVVLAHDVRLTNLFRFAAWQHPSVAPSGFCELLHRTYPDRLPPELGASGEVTPEEAERWGLLLARDVIAASTRFLTTSAFAAELARLDARPEHRHRIAHVPFGIGPAPVRPTPVAGDGRPRDTVVASFGVVNRRKQGPLLVEAFAAATAVAATDGLAAAPTLVFVGPVGDDDAATIRAVAARLEIADRVELTGSVSREIYENWLARTTIAVQLRSTTNGESSAAIGDCLAAGVPTIVTGIGASRELPTSAVVAVAGEVSAPDLGRVIGRLLASEDERQERSKAALAHAAGNTFAVAADALYREVSSDD